MKAIIQIVQQMILYLGVFILFVMPPIAFATIPIFAIVPSILKTIVSPNGVTSVTYTVTNNTHKTINNITVDPAFQTTGNASGISLQNNGCSTLNSGASCTFGVLINGKGQPSTFKITPRVCAYNGAVCSQPLCSNALQISQPTSTPIAYVGLVSGVNINHLMPINTSNQALGTPLSGFDFDIELADGVAISNDGSTVYVSSQDNNMLYVVKGGLTPSIITAITVGTTPTGVAIMPDNSKVYVANFGSNTVSVIDTTTNKISNTIAVGIAPNGLAISPDGLNVYVANFTSNTVSVINTTTNTVVATITVGTNPFATVVTPDGSTVYVTNNGSNTVSVINTSSNTVTQTIIIPGVAPSPEGLAMSPDGSNIYVANNGNATVNVISTSTNSVTNTIAIAGAPVGVAFTPDGTSFYVSNSNSMLNKVTLVNVPSYTTSNIAVTGSQITIGNFVG